MIAQPVNPARKMEEMRPLLRGNKFVMCSCERWKHMPPAPRSTVPACRALKCLVLEKPSRKSAVILRQVPAEAIAICRNIAKLLVSVFKKKSSPGRRRLLNSDHGEGYITMCTGRS